MPKARNLETYKVCPHIKVSNAGPGGAAPHIAKLPDRSMRHLLDCLPPDPPSPFGGYTLGSLRIAIRKILDERQEVRAERWIAVRREVLRWLPFVALAMVLLIGLRRR